MYTRIALLFVVTFTANLLLSCNEEPAPAEENKAIEDPTAVRPVFEPAEVSGALPVGDQGPTHNPDGTPRLNPPHGEPGHRCEIPVGAPLDGSASNADGANVQPVDISTQIPAPDASGSMSGKPNPPHGEPGHRCDIQVGDPLP